MTCPQFSVHVCVCVCVLDEQHWEHECSYTHKQYTEGVLCEVGMGEEDMTWTTCALATKAMYSHLHGPG